MISVTFICDECIQVGVGMWRAYARVPDLNSPSSLPAGWIRIIPQLGDKDRIKKGAKHLCAKCAAGFMNTQRGVIISGN